MGSLVVRALRMQGPRGSGSVEGDGGGEPRVQLCRNLGPAWREVQKIVTLSYLRWVSLRRFGWGG